MTVLEIAKNLKSRFLNGLEDDELHAVLNAAHQKQFAAKSVICTAGELSDRFYLLFSGRARHFVVTSAGHKLLLKYLVPGDVFGGRTVLAIRSKYLISTEIVKDSSVLVWDRHSIRKLLHRYHRLMDNALLVASDYLSWYTTAHVSLACLDARERLAQVISTLADTFGVPTDDGRELEIRNEDLAQAANLTPFTTSRLIAEWNRSGAIRKSHSKLVLRADPFIS